MTVVAVDVGGTSIKGALVDDDGTTRDAQSWPTPVTDGPHAVVAAIAGAARELLGGALLPVGVVVPGVVIDGVARYAANLGWRDVALRSELTSALGVPVVVGHDVRAAGLAEQTFGATRDVADWTIVVIGTGIASVQVSGGVVVGGATGTAGELGHIPVVTNGEQCACGQRGCLETYASAASIARRYGGSLTARDIAARLDTDADAARVWGDATAALGTALVTVTMLADPEVVVLAGGLAEAGETLAAPVREATAAGLAWRPAPRIVCSPLGARAGLLGAAVLARTARLPA